MARFSDSPEALFRALNSSLPVDRRLAPYDLQQSLAHVRMLARSGVIGDSDRAALERALEQVRSEVEGDGFPVSAEEEDVHMAIERRVTEIVGPVGGKLQTGRSRNDQVATDLVLFVRAHALEARAAVARLMRVLVELAERHLDWEMPGYTHLQRAQPVYLSHHLLAYFWKLRRDLGRFRFCIAATDELPLGVGALAGVNFATDRAWLARELGFGQVVPNSIDAVSNRDFVLDYLAAAATCATHLSQLGAEIVLWSSEEFGFCRVSDAFASGSSLMPQKRNPDAAELLRAKAPRVAAHASALHGVLHGLPLAYNKDLQEDKGHLFDAVDTLELCLAAAAAMLRELSFDRERLAEAAADELLGATDLADGLVRRGVPFREAHGLVAAVVRRARQRGTRPSELADRELETLAAKHAGVLRELVRRGSWTESKVSEGGTSLSRVREQLERARSVLREEAGAE